jgi:hypothetical protein
VREGNPTAKLKKTILKNIAGQFPNIAKPKAVKGYLSELRTAATAGEKQEAAFTSDVMESMGLDVLTKSKVVNCKYQFNTLVHAAGKKLEKLKLKLSASADRNTINYLAWSYREAQKVAPGKQYVLSFGHLSPDERTALNKILLRLSSPPYNMNITYIEQHL